MQSEAQTNKELYVCFTFFELTRAPPTLNKNWLKDQRNI